MPDLHATAGAILGEIANVDSRLAEVASEAHDALEAVSLGNSTLDDARGKVADVAGRVSTALTALSDIAKRLQVEVGDVQPQPTPVQSATLPGQPAVNHEAADATTRTLGNETPAVAPKGERAPFAEESDDDEDSHDKDSRGHDKSRKSSK